MRFSFVSFDSYKFEEMRWWFQGVASKYRQFFTSSFIWLVIFQAIASTAYMTKTLFPCNFWLKIELKNLFWTNFVFPPNFLMLLKWWSSIRWFSQICLNTRYENTAILLYSWLPTETYHKNLAIWSFFFFEIWQIWALFFPWKILWRGRNQNFQVEISPPKIKPCSESEPSSTLHNHLSTSFKKKEL
jgi:hypothetical protein